MAKTKDDHGLNNAKGHFTSILESYEAYLDASIEKDDQPDNWEAIEKIEEEARQSALSVEWRCADWMEAGDSDFKADQGRVLLTFGGPSLQLFVTLYDGEPSDPVLQYQDWFTPWKDLTFGEYGDVNIEDDKAEAALQWFASLFYWGE